MISRLEIIESAWRRLGRGDLGEFMYIKGNVPNSKNRLIRSFKNDAIRATGLPLADYYREVFLSNDHQT